MLSSRALPLVVVAVAACEQGDAHFTTRFASDFAPTLHAVSVLGVYQDGRMSPGGWDALRPAVASALGSDHCEVGYDSLASSDLALADAIDDYTRADGPTDPLLAQLAPAARGDLVLVLTLAGKLPQRPADAGARRTAPAPSATGGGGRRRGAGHAHGESRSESPKDTNVLEMSASLFSVAQGRTAALVGMQYSGASLDDAMSKFAAKLAQSLPGMTCAGWSWNVNIDARGIRASIDE